MQRQPNSEDRTLLATWLDGDREAGAALIQRHYRALFTFFHTRVDPDTSGDLTQSVFETLCEGGAKLREVQSMRAYLLGIARWKLVAHFRRDRSPQRAALPFDDELCVTPEPRSLSSVWQARERGSLVVEALRRLPLDQQIILELKDYEQLTAREIGEVFGIPPGTVATRIRRARQVLETTVQRLSETLGMAETTGTSLAEHMQALRRHVPGATPPKP